VKKRNRSALQDNSCRSRDQAPVPCPTDIFTVTVFREQCAVLANNAAACVQPLRKGTDSKACESWFRDFDVVTARAPNWTLPAGRSRRTSC
jgi:hypothetical protein